MLRSRKKIDTKEGDLLGWLWLMEEDGPMQNAMRCNYGGYYENSRGEVRKVVGSYHIHLRLVGGVRIGTERRRHVWISNRRGGPRRPSQRHGSGCGILHAGPASTLDFSVSLLCRRTDIEEKNPVNGIQPGQIHVSHATDTPIHQ